MGAGSPPDQKGNPDRSSSWVHAPDQMTQPGTQSVDFWYLGTPLTFPWLISYLAPRIGEVISSQTHPRQWSGGSLPRD